MARISRLEKLLYRLEAQHACLAWAFKQIQSRPGIIFELGLGHGRTFDHLRGHLPGREIYVFDRVAESYPDCTPNAPHLVLGELAETLPEMACKFAGKVVLAHSDVGSFEAEHNTKMSALVSRYLPPALARDAIILSDLPLEIAGAAALPLPRGARKDRYYLYRFAGSP
jgi:hypothetical protein